MLDSGISGGRNQQSFRLTGSLSSSRGRNTGRLFLSKCRTRVVWVCVVAVVVCLFVYANLDLDSHTVLLDESLFLSVDNSPTNSRASTLAETESKLIHLNDPQENDGGHLVGKASQSKPEELNVSFNSDTNTNTNIESTTPLGPTGASRYSSPFPEKMFEKDTYGSPSTPSIVGRVTHVPPRDNPAKSQINQVSEQPPIGREKHPSNSTKSKEKRTALEVSRRRHSGTQTKTSPNQSLEEQVGSYMHSNTTVAHAISFLKCGHALTSKYKDAMLVLRHSIHQNSIHAGNSKYSYKMYAFVNSDPEQKCIRYVDWIHRMGYTPVVLPNPVNVSTIENKHFREQIDRTGVTGSSELIKLYLYRLTNHPVVVHWDIDIVILRPMDDLFDAILYDKDSPEGRSARSNLKLQQPLYQRLPDRIDAFFTRDIALARPWQNRQVAQGGFLVARPNQDAFESYLRVMHEANYSSRCDNSGGWGNLGYGCKQGAMHYQGVVAYFYDQIYPGRGHGVELDVCIWNQIGHGVIYEGKKKEWYGSCRQSPIYGGNESTNRPEFGACHDCRILPIEETMTIHYTACSKPWQCRHTKQNAEEAATATTNATTCGLLHREFFRIRNDLESRLIQLLGDSMQSKLHEGKTAFYPEYFLGYCGGKSGGAYVGMKEFPENFTMTDLYGF